MMSEKNSNCQNTGLSRRRFIRDTGIVTTALASSVILSSCQNDNNPPANTTSTGEAEPAKLEVFNPTGSIEVTHLHAARLGSLEGKTICEVTNGDYNFDNTFPRLRQTLQNLYPGSSFIPYTEFETIPNVVDEDSIAGILAALEEAGCDGVIVGNAG
ncbi:MAG: hypothetical protein WCS74_03200 [Dehalococcoidales bacterium]|nr:hypothetical protein [Dehalococcoidales bacterium]MDD4322901.1 hypothetical protein [Dehalococcoidales bacterium]